MGRFLPFAAACLALFLSPASAAAAGEAAGAAAEAEDLKKKHHHHHRHHHKGHHHRSHHSVAQAHHNVAQAHHNVAQAHHSVAQAHHHLEASKAAEVANATKTKAHESEAVTKKSDTTTQPPIPLEEGLLQVNAPLPANFAELFAKGVAAAVGCNAKEVKVLGTKAVQGEKGELEEVRFSAKKSVVEAVLDQAADADSKLATGSLCPFLVAKLDEGDVREQCEEPAETKSKEKEEEEKEEEPKAASVAEDDEAEAPAPPRRRRPARPVEAEAAAVAAGGDVDVDMEAAMPYGDLEPFGREDTAQELTESAIKESNAMVDQLERAEVAEEKRAVFRALTRLRGAAITSFDGIARSQTGSIDEYNKLHQWRSAHPLNHLANEEADISKWAFPDAAL